MNKSSKSAQSMKATMDKPAMTMGIDVGDRHSHLCLVDDEGEIVKRDRVRSTEAAFRRHFEGAARLRIALECGTHSPWMSRLLKQLGHQVIVANARKIPTITQSESKNDWRDAEQLARMAAFNPKLLSPLEHRSLDRQQDLNLIQARAILVKARTMIANALRGLVKSAGGRLPACSTESLPHRAPGAVPPALAEVADPLIEQLARLNLQIHTMDEQIEKLAAKYPEIDTLRSTPGVGALVAATYVLTLDRPNAAPSNRSAGAFLGLRPAQSQSGASDPQPGSPAIGLRRWGGKAHHPHRQHLSALSAGAVGAIHPGPFWPRFGLAKLGPEAGPERRQTSQEASHRRRGPQTGRPPAQHVAQRPALPTLSTTGSDASAATSQGAGLRSNPTATCQPAANQPGKIATRQ